MVLTPATDSAGNKYSFSRYSDFCPRLTRPVSDLFLQQNCSLHIQGYTERTNHQPKYSSPSVVGCSWPSETMTSVGPVYRERHLHLRKASSCSSQRRWTYRPHPLEHRRRSDVAGQVRRGCASGLWYVLFSLLQLNAYPLLFSEIKHMMNANYECEHVSGTSLLNPRKQRGMQELAFNIWFYSFMLFPSFAFTTLIAYYPYRRSWKV